MEVEVVNQVVRILEVDTDDGIDVIEVPGPSEIIEVGVQGPPGAQGPAGPQGPTGPPGTSGTTFTHVHDQATPTAMWTITHNLNGFPNVTAVDSAGTVVEGDVTWTSPNQLTVAFSSAFSGKAYLS